MSRNGLLDPAVTAIEPNQSLNDFIIIQNLKKDIRILENINGQLKHRIKELETILSINSKEIENKDNIILNKFKQVLIKLVRKN